MAARTHVRPATSTEASTVPFWLDSPARPEPTQALRGEAATDLLIVGGGFTGLWAAMQAKERDPSREVLLLESHEIAFGATGRNGGFLDPSLTHGLENGARHFPGELRTLDKLARRNLEELFATLDRYGIDADVERTGEMTLARRPHEIQGLREQHDLARTLGIDSEWLEGAALRDEIRSPVFLAGRWERDTVALVDPAKLAWGLRNAALELGVRIHEHSPVVAIDRDGKGMVAATERGRIRARRVLLATNGYPGLVRAIDRRIVPVYDYVLVTEPLTSAQRDAIGWGNRQGLADASNRFHYFRLTPDDRILWGGYDAVYHYGSGIRPEFDQRPATFDLLERNFFETFPQLDPIRFSHRWGGVIDTSTRVCATFGTAHRGRVAYSVGYTGLGLGASRFGAAVALDLLEGIPTERTELQLVRKKSVPFPPEPLRWAGVELTRNAMARADRSGRRGPWLRLLDALKLGFDS
ncbi:MAG: FAD-dependent oxidoreductase [Actinomycetota bacterium]